MTSKPPTKIDPRMIAVPRPDPTSAHEPGRSEPSETSPNNPSPSEDKDGDQAADAIATLLPEHPLRKFSLLGMADEIEAKAGEAKPLLGKLAWQGQATMIYAEPNTGKTLVVLKLLLDAITSGRIGPSNVYVVNADDGSAALATKLRVLQDEGAHMLVPGYGGFEVHHLIGMLIQAAKAGSASGTCIVIDTVKKVADLMDKKRSSEFGQACRLYASMGGTIIGLGHTTKNPNSNGTPRYQGTTDILEDFDAVYVAEPLASKRDPNQRLVKFTRKKCRGDNPEVAAYGYAADPKIPYTEMLASVSPVDPEDMEDYAPRREDVSDPQVMSVVVQLIKAGSVQGQMALAKAVADQCGISHRAALGILNQYTGKTPNEHLWDFDKGPRGVRIYRLIDQTKPAA